MHVLVTLEMPGLCCCFSPTKTEKESLGPVLWLHPFQPSWMESQSCGWDTHETSGHLLQWLPALVIINLAGLMNTTNDAVLGGQE